MREIRWRPPETLLEAEREAKILLAGEMAERAAKILQAIETEQQIFVTSEFEPDEFQSADDRAKVLCLAERFVGEYSSQWIQNMELQASVIIERHWRKVHGLARALASKRRLPSSEVISILENGNFQITWGGDERC